MMASVVVIILASSFGVDAFSSGRPQSAALIIPSRPFAAATNRHCLNGQQANRLPFVLSMSPLDSSDDSIPDDDAAGDEEGMSLAADLFKIASERGVVVDDDDLDDDDYGGEDMEVETDIELALAEDAEEEDEDDEEEEEINIPPGAIDAFLGRDSADAAELAAENVTLSNEKLYEEMKERVFDTAGGFLKYVEGTDDDDDDDDVVDDDDNDLVLAGETEEISKPKIYVPPDVIPDPELTAGEVVTLILDAFKHNDVPTSNRGVEIFFGYSSPGSQVKALDPPLSPEEYVEFLKDEQDGYGALFEHKDVQIEKGDYSFDRKKAFYTARLIVGDDPRDFTSVNFILSTSGSGDDSCWLIDSMLIRPEKMRRGRRR